MPIDNGICTFSLIDVLNQTMFQSCAISHCQCIARTLCYGCNRNFCRDHMLEHDLSLNSQLNPLAEQINQLDERLKSIDLEQTRRESYQKLEQWKSECYLTIERFFEEKCRDLDRLLEKKIDQKQKDIERIRGKMTEFVREQEATHTEIDTLTSMVRDLEHEIHQIEQTSFQLNIQSLILDETLIHFEDQHRIQFDLSSLSSVYKSINYPRDNWAPIACNQQYLFIYQEPNLCLLDRDLNRIKQKSWTYGTIYDMCWSTGLNRFIILNSHDVFLVDVLQMSIEHIPILRKHKWLSCTTSDSSLYLTTKVWGSSLFEYRLIPTIELIKQWHCPETCSSDEVINAIVYHHQCLAMMIKNTFEKSIHFEMRSMTNLQRLWTVKFNLPSSQNIRTRCCLLNTNQWLVIDRNTSRIFYISKEGKLKSSIIYNPPAFSGVIFDQNLLAISTARGVNLHKFDLLM